MRREDKDYETVFHLYEAAIHLKELVQDIKKGEIDPFEDTSSLEVELCHIQEHLCLSWHLREYYMGEFERDTETDFLLRSTIPNWQASFSLIASSEKPGPNNKTV